MWRVALAMVLDHSIEKAMHGVGIEQRKIQHHYRGGICVDRQQHVERRMQRKTQRQDERLPAAHEDGERQEIFHQDRKSTRLNSSHQIISYAVFCLKKKNVTSPVRQITLITVDDQMPS